MAKQDAILKEKEQEREEKVIEAETTVVDITLVDEFLPAE